MHRLQKKRRDISVRVMWDSELKREEAEKIARIIEDALRQHGYRIKVSRYGNRENSGGRIYFAVS